MAYNRVVIHLVSTAISYQSVIQCMWVRLMVSGIAFALNVFTIQELLLFDRNAGENFPSSSSSMIGERVLAQPLQQLGDENPTGKLVLELCMKRAVCITKPE